MGSEHPSAPALPVSAPLAHCAASRAPAVSTLLALSSLTQVIAPWKGLQLSLRRGTAAEGEGDKRDDGDNDDGAATAHPEAPDEAPRAKVNNKLHPLRRALSSTLLPWGSARRKVVDERAKLREKEALLAAAADALAKVPSNAAAKVRTAATKRRDIAAKNLASQTAKFTEAQRGLEQAFSAVQTAHAKACEAMVAPRASCDDHLRRMTKRLRATADIIRSLSKWHLPTELAGVPEASGLSAACYAADVWAQRICTERLWGDADGGWAACCKAALGLFKGSSNEAAVRLMGHRSFKSTAASRARRGLAKIGADCRSDPAVLAGLDLSGLSFVYAPPSVAKARVTTPYADMSEAQRKECSLVCHNETVAAALAALDEVWSTDGSVVAERDSGNRITSLKTTYSSLRWRSATDARPEEVISRAAADGTTIFRAELRALTAALESAASSARAAATIGIATDSRSAMQALEHLSTADADVRRAWQAIRTLMTRGAKVVIAHVFSHYGLHINEAADAMAASSPPPADDDLASAWMPHTADGLAPFWEDTWRNEERRYETIEDARCWHAAARPLRFFWSAAPHTTWRDEARGFPVAAFRALMQARSGVLSVLGRLAWAKGDPRDCQICGAGGVHGREGNSVTHVFTCNDRNNMCDDKRQLLRMPVFPTIFTTAKALHKGITACLWGKSASADATPLQNVGEFISWYATTAMSSLSPGTVPTPEGSVQRADSVERATVGS